MDKKPRRERLSAQLRANEQIRDERLAALLRAKKHSGSEHYDRVIALLERDREGTNE